MRYSALFTLLVIVGCVVHDGRAQTPGLAFHYFESGQKEFAEHDFVAAWLSNNKYAAGVR
jgi:hypothetical protein